MGSEMCIRDSFLGLGASDASGAIRNYANRRFLAWSSQFVVQGFAKSELVCLVTATVGRVGRFDMGIKYPKVEFRGHWPLRL